MSDPAELMHTRIVVIDDDDLVRDSMCVFLEDCGYNVVSAARARDGLKICKEDPPAVVLCDLRMPDMDGLQVLEVLTREQPGLPVIVVSGAGVMTDVVEALRLGASDYLVKPIADLEVLAHAIRSVIHKVSLEKENRQYRDELEAANIELEENLDLLRRDHEAGRQAQLQLLPEPLARFGDWEFSHAVLPSLYLSGDFLDYFEIDADHVGFYLADVSGHGAASAFVTMMLKSLINHPLRRFRSFGETVILDPAALLSYLNSEVLQANLGKYLTLFYGVLNIRTGHLKFANGGHYPRPLLTNGSKQQFLGGNSFPVGLFDWASYENEERRLEAKASLLLCSDGVLEIPNGSALAKDETLILSLTDSGVPGVNALLERATRLVQGAPIDDIALFLIRHL
ncbi:SpoIIE family protein phosphatase [Permianibacter aggregans]|uniref:Serine phosphatase RsbU (Regulator of sigma subunit) n=1 Tax=Permianibacter aggregans TaxID=1510150 RepID=A0A4R6UY16_9GAMM|nr:SpoIIE family protein phosphatase [Permianibacter aggregans]QGX41407.1 response regulator [Permianibacter aggregans]TDQ51196.1 serine phosphatase RsbU (regulator of sigma subunit) [Permianibacter aggregans]